MTRETKLQIVEALERWVAEHGVTSQNELSKLLGINASYLIAMRKGDDSIKLGADKTVAIKEEFYHRIATHIGLELEKPLVGVKPTDQLNHMVLRMTEAREQKATRLIVGSTGSGKTFSIELFRKRYPLDTAVVKIGSSDSLKDIIDKIHDGFMRLVDGRYYARSYKSAQLKNILSMVDDLQRAGKTPTLIVDEIEFMKLATVNLFKELYDVFDGRCALVLVGTDEFLVKIGMLKTKHRLGIAQFERRLRFKTYTLPTIDTLFGQFLNDESIAPDARKWIVQHCNNYGEVSDVLKACLAEAKARGGKLTVEIIKLVLGIA